MDKKKTHHEMYERCKQHMHSYVLVETTDGMQMDGIITGVDDENVYLAVPINQQEPEYVPTFSNVNPYDGYDRRSNPNPRSYPYGRNPYPYYPPRYGYGYGYRPNRRFRRLVLPLAFLAGLSLLPWY